MENNCYMTLVTELKYVPCVKNCNALMKYYNSQFPYIALVPEDSIDLQNQLAKADIQYIPIKIDKFGSDTRICPLFADTINKFQIFNFAEYEKICFIDADIIIRANIDYLFDKLQNKSTHFFPAGRKDSAGKSDGFGGELFIVRPDLAMYPRVLADKGLYTNDEEVLKAYFFNEDNIEERDFPSDKLIHFSGLIKIWERCNTSFSQIWRHFYDECTSIDDLVHFVENIEHYQGHLNTWTRLMKAAFQLQLYVVLVQNPQDLQKAIQLEQKLQNEYGCRINFMYVMGYQDDEAARYLANNQKNFIWIHLPQDNLSFIQILNSVSYEMMSIGCSTFCFIYNLDMNITENLDYLFSPYLYTDRRQIAIEKYQNDLYLCMRRLID